MEEFLSSKQITTPNMSPSLLPTGFKASGVMDEHPIFLDVEDGTFSNGLYSNNHMANMQLNPIMMDSLNPSINLQGNQLFLGPDDTGRDLQFLTSKDDVFYPDFSRNKQSACLEPESALKLGLEQRLSPQFGELYGGKAQSNQRLKINARLGAGSTNSPQNANNSLLHPNDFFEDLLDMYESKENVFDKEQPIRAQLASPTAANPSSNKRVTPDQQLIDFLNASSNNYQFAERNNIPAGPPYNDFTNNNSSCSSSSSAYSSAAHLPSSKQAFRSFQSQSKPSQARGLAFTSLLSGTSQGQEKAYSNASRTLFSGSPPELLRSNQGWVRDGRFPIQTDVMQEDVQKPPIFVTSAPNGDKGVNSNRWLASSDQFGPRTGANNIQLKLQKNLEIVDRFSKQYATKSGQKYFLELFDKVKLKQFLDKVQGLHNVDLFTKDITKNLPRELLQDKGLLMQLNSCFITNIFSHLNGGAGSIEPSATPQPRAVHMKIGPLTIEERRKKIERYLQKKKKRTFSKKISYDCRKRVADNRLRIKGRFVTKQQAFEQLGGGDDVHDDSELKVLLKEKFGSKRVRTRKDEKSNNSFSSNEGHAQAEMKSEDYFYDLTGKAAEELISDH